MVALQPACFSQLHYAAILSGGGAESSQLRFAQFESHCHVLTCRC